MNAVVAPLIAQGQSPYVIAANHPELNISMKGLYNYIHQGVLLVRGADLKRKVKFNPRRCRREKGIDRGYQRIELRKLRNWMLESSVLLCYDGMQ